MASSRLQKAPRRRTVQFQRDYRQTTKTSSSDHHPISLPPRRSRRQLPAQLAGEESARVHAEVDGGRQSDERGGVLGAPDVRHADLHGGPAAPALPLHGGRHHEAARGPERVAAQLAAAPPGGSGRGQVDGEPPAAGRRDAGLGHAHARARDVAVVVGHQLEAVAQLGVPGAAAAIAPALEAAPRRPGPVHAAAEDEPAARVGAAHAVRPRGRHERRHHRRQRHRRPRQVVHRHRPPLALLPRALALALGPQLRQPVARADGARVGLHGPGSTTIDGEGLRPDLRLQCVCVCVCVCVGGGGGGGGGGRNLVPPPLTASAGRCCCGRRTCT
uniref:Uncharacterized protein n=1 Tax=Zea mays TaxID=4577 RepID=A0A804Q3S2_MAIZE